MRSARLLCFAISTSLASQTLIEGNAPELFKSHCAGCHGATGQGSRGPALRVPLLKRANDLDSMVSLLRRGVDGTEMAGIPPVVIGEQPMRALAAYVLAMRTHKRDAASGRIERGRELFRTKGKCLGCHRVNGDGRTLAPDLSDIGRHRDLKWLRRAVVEPGADIFDSFEGYRWAIPLPDNYVLVDLTTKKSEKITGHRLNEDAFSIQIRDGEGRPRSFLKSELAELHKHWGKSPMPSYKDVFAGDELEDVIAYLASLRGTR